MKPIRARIRGKIHNFYSHRDLARFLMQTLVADERSPFEARSRNLHSILELLNFTNKARWIEKIHNEEYFDKAYWEVMLSLEGLGTLPGFSIICNIEKGDSNYNPEKRRISTDWTLLED